jgi:signal transduction histidine kinase
MSDDSAGSTAQEAQEAISSVYHDLNNPLSIISGNAQFLLELSREEDIDDQFVSSVQDIKEAAQQMAESMERLNRLKEAMGDGSLTADE